MQLPPRTNKNEGKKPDAAKVKGRARKNEKLRARAAVKKRRRHFAKTSAKS
jgi:hypothetical protein